MDAKTAPHVTARARRVWAALSVYGLLPGLSLLLCALIVVLQLSGAAALPLAGTMTLSGQLAALQALSERAPATSVSPPAPIALCAPAEPTAPSAVHQSAPAGIYPILTTTIRSESAIINATEHRPTQSAHASALPQSESASGPQVLVLHTHATEAFFDPATAAFSGIVIGQSPSVCGYYDPKASLRSTDNTRNMVEVGRVFCQTLAEHGVEAVHCTVQHDLDYSAAYGLALRSIEEYLEKYPSIRYVLDLHRDSLVRDNGDKLSPTCLLEGERVSQVMLVVGAGSESLPQEHWERTLSYAMRYQSYLRDVDGQFARPVYLRYGRFNQHVTPAMWLLEVGSCGSTLAEACRASEYAAGAFAEMLAAAEK